MSRTASILVAVFLLGFLPFAAYCFATPGQNLIPEGCDEFGYLQMARAFDEGRALESHGVRPFDKALIAHLDARFDYDDYAKLITPHAYHVDPGTAKVINQYPPGTSYLLSFLPIHDRYALFPPLAMFVLLVPLALVLLLAGDRESRVFQVAALLLLGMVCLLAPPFSRGFETITSIAPTYGLLLGAGFLLRRHPRWAILLIGTTTLFRVANLITVLPVLLIVAIERWRATRPRVVTLAKGSAMDGAAFVLGGYGLYLVYVWALLGNPFRFTYSRSDQAWLPLQELWTGFAFYFDVHSSWMWAHVVAIGLMLAAAFGSRADVRWLLLCLLVPVCNYAFYVGHKVQIFYYPYASALLLIGVLVEMLDAGAWHRDLRQRIVVVAACGCVCLLPLLRLPHVETAAAFSRERQLYREELGGYDVVWAELRSGTVEYLVDTAGFRYGWGKPEARVAAMRLLSRAGYKQAVLTSEKNIDHAAVVAELEAHGIAFDERRSRLGRIVVLGQE